MTPNALIFDMDGLLIDSEPLWWSVEKQLAAEHGKVWTDEMAHACIGKGLPNAVNAIASNLAIDIETDAGVRYLVDKFIERKSELQLKAGARELIEKAQRGSVRLALASSSTKRLIAAVMDRFSDIAPAFAHLVSGEHVENSKPAPDIFLLAASRLGVAPDGCVVLEDSIAGVKAGVAAGMMTIAVPEFERASFDGLTPHILDDLHQAVTLLGL